MEAIEDLVDEKTLDELASEDVEKTEEVPAEEPEGEEPEEGGEQAEDEGEVEEPAEPTEEPVGGEGEEEDEIPDIEIPEPQTPDALPVQTLLRIRHDAEQAVLQQLGLEEPPDPDIDRHGYNQFMTAVDALARRIEANVVTQSKAYAEAQKMMIDLGAEKRERFIRFFDDMVMKMAQKPHLRQKAEIIMRAAQTGDYATLYPVMKKMYQTFAMKSRKVRKPPKTEKPASGARPRPAIEPGDAISLARQMGYEYPELQ